MPSLSEEDRARAIAILEELRLRIAEVGGDDRERLFQVRRYILKRLEFDERGTPTQRRKLKDAKAWLGRAGGGALDGVIAKPLDQAYLPGERAMLKVKCLRSADCVVGGFRYATGSRQVGAGREHRADLPQGERYAT